MALRDVKTDNDETTTYYNGMTDYDGLIVDFSSWVNLYYI